MDIQTQQNTTTLAPIKQETNPSIRRYLEPLHESDFTPSQKEALTQFITLAELNNWTLSSIAKKLNVSETTVHRVLSGTYTGRKSKYISQIESISRIYQNRMLSGQKLPFIETKLARWIMRLAELTHSNRYASIIIGESQWGKTEAIKEYARRNPEKVILVRCPVSASPSRILKRICQAMGLVCGQSAEAMIYHITQRLTEDHLLIVDEIHHILDSDRQGRKCVEQIRELYDMSGCGLFLVATPVFEKALKSGPLAGVLEQLGKRNASHSWKLPETIADEDLRAIWQHYEFPKPTVGELNVLRELAKETGFGMFIKRIVLAYQECKKAGLQPTWADFASAHRQMKGLEKGIMPEDF